jgi:hypothetical protein
MIFLLILLRVDLRWPKCVGRQSYTFLMPEAPGRQPISHSRIGPVDSFWLAIISHAVSLRATLSERLTHRPTSNHEVTISFEVEMGFLKNFFTNVLNEQPQVNTTNSFARLSENDLEQHLSVSKYGDFPLTDAVRPSYDLKVIPTQGYRHEFYRDEQDGSSIPVVMGAASKEMLFETFMELLEPLGSVVDVVLETSHDRDQAGHEDLYREHIDMPVLKSILWDFEDLLTNDGCTGIAILNPRIPLEVQLDEHKLMIMYGQSLAKFERILESSNIKCDEEMQFITEAEHVHSSCDKYLQEFERLKTSLGMDGGGFYESADDADYCM